MKMACYFTVPFNHTFFHTNRWKSPDNKGKLVSVIQWKASRTAVPQPTCVISIIFTQHGQTNNSQSIRCYSAPPIPYVQPANTWQTWLLNVKSVHIAYNLGRNGPPYGWRPREGVCSFKKQHVLYVNYDFLFRNSLKFATSLCTCRNI